MRLRSLILILVAALAIPLLPATAQARDRSDSIESYLSDRMAETGVPGAAVSIIDGDQIGYTGQLGHTGDGAKITEDTPFMWGSLAKPMTAVIVLGLAEDGKLSTDAPASRYLKDFAPTWNDKTAEPTIDQLLSHTSGLPGVEGAEVTDRETEGADAVSKVAAELNDIALATKPGTEHTYSSLNYLVLGSLVEKVTGKRFTEVMRERVFDKLGMTDVITDAKDADRRLPSGNRLWFGQPIAQRSTFDNSGVPYGYLGGSITELSRFARAALSHDERLLSEESWAQAQSPQTKTSSGHYGYGWSIRELSGEPVLFHTGMTPGFHTNVIVMPQRDTAIVVNQNAYSEAWALPLRSTSEGIARLWIGEKPEQAHAPDPLTAYAPWVLAAIALLLLAWAALSAFRRVGQRSASRIRVAAWVAFGLLVPAVMLWLAPMWIGVTPRVLWLFQPDLAVTAVAVAVAALALAAVRCVKLARATRSAR